MCADYAYFPVRETILIEEQAPPVSYFPDGKSIKNSLCVFRRVLFFAKHSVPLQCYCYGESILNISYIIRRVLSYMHHIGFFLSALLLTGSAGAQFYESGTEPASVRWQQINTEHFRIIFPKGASREGQRAANVLEYIHQAEGKTLGHYPGKIPVVLHNRTAYSNGFVSWAPKRSEWFLTPPQNNYAQDWQDQLAIHEYRHVVQIDRLNRGLTRALGFVAGQQAVGAVSGLLPKWFLEGDAVAAETALTSAGRGRNPAFEMPLRTIALSGKYQKYDKAFFGSYRDHVPNHYELGYQMVGWTRENYGAQTFETAVDFTARKPYLFFLYPFKFGLKKETGYYTGQLYRNAFTDLTRRWSEQEMQTGYDSITPLTGRTSGIYTNYRSPQYLDDSGFVVQKTGMAQIAQWVKVDRDGREQALHTPGFINSDRISYSSGLLAWTEQVQDIRWTNRSYSVVKLFDLQTGKERTLRQRTRYYSPALSPDGATIAVVDVPVEGACNIVLLDVAAGEVIDRLPNPDGAFLQTPAWCRDGKSILVIVNNGDGKSIARIDAATGQYVTVLPPACDDISCPADGGKHAFFTGHYNGITNVYAVDYRTGKLMQVTSARFGASDPQPNAAGDKLACVEYSVQGYNLVETGLDTAKWTPVSKLADHSLKLYETLAGQENFNMQDSVIPNVQHTMKKYRKWAHWFNLHSWAPLYYEVDASNVTSTDFYPGVVLLSQDLSGNLVSSAGYSWRGYNAFHAAFTYTGLYPVIDFKVDYGGRTTIVGPSGDGSYPLNPQDKAAKIIVRSYIPFTFTRNRWITGVIPQVMFSYDNSYLYPQITGNRWDGLYEMGYSLQAYRYLKTSVRDLAPRLGFTVQGSFRHTPWNTGLLGYIYCVYGRVYLPGVARHHSLQLTGAWQQQETDQYLFGSLLKFPRGYARGRTEKLSIGSIDYSLPLVYPDWNWSFFVYLKRLRTNLFCDVARNRYRAFNPTVNQVEWQKNRLLSTGIDLLADVNLLQINFPVSVGIRTVYVPDKNEVQPSLLFNVTLN
jgi:hypothetical protein